MHIYAGPAVPGSVFRMLPGPPGFLYFGWLSGAALKSDFSLLIFVDSALRRPRPRPFWAFPGTTRGGLDRRNLCIFTWFQEHAQHNLCIFTLVSHTGRHNLCIFTLVSRTGRHNLCIFTWFQEHAQHHLCIFTWFQEHAQHHLCIFT